MANLSTGFRSAILGPQSFAAIFQDGCIEVRSGPAPEVSVGGADAAAIGTLLGRITRDGLAWTAGAPQGGLRFVAGGIFVSKQFDHVWRLQGIDTGTAGHFRVVANAPDSGLASQVLPRIDGNIGPMPETGIPTGLYDMDLPTINITPTTIIPMEQWLFAIPPL